MGNFICYYGMTSVVCIILYEVAVFKSGIFKISTLSLILRFLFSLVFGPVLLLIWIVATIIDSICMSTVSSCKLQIDMDKIYIESLKRKYENLDDMSYDEMCIVTSMAKKTMRMYKKVKRCSSFVKVYAKYTIFIRRKLI